MLIFFFQGNKGTGTPLGGPHFLEKMVFDIPYESSVGMIHMKCHPFFQKIKCQVLFFFSSK